MIRGLLAALAMLASSALASGQEHHHHPAETITGATGKFYDTWRRPDAPDVSCCNKIDCYATPVRWEREQLQARRREDGKWLTIPTARIEHNRDSPDGRSHMCAPSPYSVDDHSGQTYYDAVSDTVYCFVLGTEA